MFIVKKKPLSANTIWDAQKGKPLCEFVKGELKTNDSELVEKLKEMGYEVSGEEDTPVKTHPDDVEDGSADHEKPDDGKGGEEDMPAKESKPRKTAKN